MDAPADTDLRRQPRAGGPDIAPRVGSDGCPTRAVLERSRIQVITAGRGTGGLPSTALRLEIVEKPLTSPGFQLVRGHFGTYKTPTSRQFFWVDSGGRVSYFPIQLINAFGKLNHADGDRRRTTE
jgi:hypothetical protein